MRAAVTRARSEMALVDVPEPGPPGPGELVVRPEAVGLCGSDFHYFHGDIPGHDLPADPGARVLGAGRGGWGARPGHARRGAAALVVRRVLPLPDRPGERVREHQPDRGPPGRRAPGAPHGAGRERLPRERHRCPPRRVRRADVDRGADRRARAGSRRASTCSCSAPARSGRRWRSQRSTAAPRCCSSTGWSGGWRCPAPRPGSSARTTISPPLPAPGPETRPRSWSRRPARRSRCARRSRPSRPRAVSSSWACPTTRCRSGSAGFRSASSTCSGSAAATRASSRWPPTSSSRWHEAVAPLLTHDFSFEEAPEAIAYAIDHPDEVMKAVIHVR